MRVLKLLKRKMAIFIKCTMSQLKLFIFFLLLVISLDAWTQTDINVPVVNFEQLEPFLNKSNDTVYVINFWATWCVPCRKELPEFQKLYQDKSQKNVSLLLVSLDFPDQIESTLKPFLEKNGITIPLVLLDDPNSNAWIDRVDPAWSGALPATLIYKDRSKIFFEKELTYFMLIEAINNLNN